MTIERYVPELTEQQQRWLRFFAVVVAAMLLLWVSNWLRGVLTPLAAALALAYILNPVVTWCERRYNAPRVVVVSAGLILLLIVLVVLLVAATLQVIQLADRAPEYLSRIAEWIGATFPGLIPSMSAADASTSAPRDGGANSLAAIVQAQGLRVGTSVLAFVTGLLSNVVYWASLGVLLPMYTFFFLLNFNEIIATVRSHLPAVSRPLIVDLATTVDRSVASFFRGRITVCFAVGVLTGIGWLIVGVPYNLALGLLAGLLNLVPFMSFLALPPAMILSYLYEVDTGGNWLWGLVGVLAVYLIVQAIESFVLTPVIESQASGLHPVTTIVALLIGAQVAGLLGMLLAIPIASTLKSMAKRYVMPEVRRLAVEAPAAAARPPNEGGGEAESKE